MHPNDEELVDRWQRGDAEAMAALVERYLSPFFGAARGMSLSAVDAEDVVQEAMMKVIRSIDSFNGRASFRTWSYTILLNTIRSHFRKQADQRKRIDCGSNVQQVRAPCEGDAKSQVDEDCARIDQAMARLSEKQRTAFAMMVLEGFTAAQVAEMENCSVDAVYQRVTEARKSLRKEPALQEIWYE